MVSLLLNRMSFSFFLLDDFDRFVVSILMYFDVLAARLVQLSSAFHSCTVFVSR